MRILVIDVGGTHVKVLATGHSKWVEIPSGPKMTPAKMVAAVRAATAGWKYDAVSIGYPGPVVHDHPLAEPHNLAAGWIDFPYQKAFGKPLRFINDAAMQALGGYKGGRMLFLGIGTGLGSAMIFDGVVIPLELAHLPYRKGRTYEDYVGLRGLERRGVERWRKSVLDVIERLGHVLEMHGHVADRRSLRQSARGGDQQQAGEGHDRKADSFHGVPPFRACRAKSLH